jgi:hypothetical protein
MWHGMEFMYQARFFCEGEYARSTFNGCTFSSAFAPPAVFARGGAPYSSMTAT